MGTATLIEQFQPGVPVGAACATGEIITISGYTFGVTYGQNRFTVFDPSSETSALYEMTLPFYHLFATQGCPFDGGVAVVAKANGSNPHLLILYPDGTYDVYDCGVWWGSGNTQSCGPVDLGGHKIAMWPTGSGYAPRMFDRSTSTWTTWPTSLSTIQPQVWGGKVWTADGSNVYGRSVADGSVVTTLSGGFSASGNTVVKDGELWGRTSYSTIGGVDLVTNARHSASIPYDLDSMGMALGASRLWVANPDAIYSSDGAALETYPHANKGVAGSIHYSNGCAWAMHTAPAS